MNLIFLDIDGVLNCQLFFDINTGKRELRKSVKSGNLDKDDYYGSQLCLERIGWLNDLCKEVDAKIVISSTWRLGKTIEELQSIFNKSGATFEIIDKTPNLRGNGCLRGNEIYQWIYDNSEKICGKPYYEFKSYAIIDDDSDMLLWQAPHFFKTDNYSGLTPNTCYKIKQFFTHKLFYSTD